MSPGSPKGRTPLSSTEDDTNIDGDGFKLHTNRKRKTRSSSTSPPHPNLKQNKVLQTIGNSVVSTSNAFSLLEELNSATSN